MRSCSDPQDSQTDRGAEPDKHVHWKEKKYRDTKKETEWRKKDQFHQGLREARLYLH